MDLGKTTSESDLSTWRKFFQMNLLFCAHESAVSGASPVHQGMVLIVSIKAIWCLFNGCEFFRNSDFLSCNVPWASMMKMQKFPHVFLLCILFLILSVNPANNNPTVVSILGCLEISSTRFISVSQLLQPFPKTWDTNKQVLSHSVTHTSSSPVPNNGVIFVDTTWVQSLLLVSHSHKNNSLHLFLRILGLL